MLGTNTLPQDSLEARANDILSIKTEEVYDTEPLEEGSRLKLKYAEIDFPEISEPELAEDLQLLGNGTNIIAYAREQGTSELLKGIIEHTVGNTLVFPVQYIWEDEKNIRELHEAQPKILPDVEGAKEVVRDGVNFIHEFKEFLKKDPLPLKNLEEFTRVYFALDKRYKANPVFNLEGEGMEGGKFDPLFLLHVFELIKNSAKNPTEKQAEEAIPVDVNITVNKALNNEYIEVDVQDNGIGVSPDREIRSILGESTTNSTGFGLNALKDYAVSRNGVLRIESNGRSHEWPEPPDGKQIEQEAIKAGTKVKLIMPLNQVGH